MITCAATLDVPRPVVDHLARLLAAHRRRIGTPTGSRALGCFRQAAAGAALVPRARLCALPDPGRRICPATGYRYLHEGIDVLAERAPDLHEVLRRGHDEGIGHVILDSTLIACDRVAGGGAASNDLWYSGKHHMFGGNI